jgi:hypothetical protein
MRSLKMVALAILTVASGIVWTPAASASGSSATCTFAAPYAASGVTLTPEIFHYNTEGNAAVYCIGSIYGDPVAGPGTFYEDGYLYGTCLQGYGPPPGHAGSDSYTASIPVFKNGKTVNVSLSGTYDTHYLAGLGTEVGTSGTLETATWQYVLLTGNCVITPATQVLVIQQMVIHT